MPQPATGCPVWDTSPLYKIPLLHQLRHQLARKLPSRKAYDFYFGTVILLLIKRVSIFSAVAWKEFAKSQGFV